MIRHHSPLRRWAHLGLLFAALLHLTGAALGPWAHTRGRELSAEVTVCAPDEHGPHTPGAHDESACGVWQVLTSPATLPAGFSIPVAWT
ncbi:MAG TPA: hypothetical protein VHG28_15150, partial [Longimicrobiaceae bacterium]|nr:hypothetical protein [Longimicrobiaceae bacterium]